MIFTTLASTLALVASAAAYPGRLAARAAPAVTYPHANTVWENSWWHNVTWAPQQGSGSIALVRGGSTQILKSNVDLNQGRTEVQVPNGASHATDYTIQITVGNDRSVSPNFAIADHAAAGTVASSLASSASGTASGAVSSASGAASSLASGASSVVASASSAASSVLSSASSVASSAVSSASSALSSAESASGSVVGSVSSEFNSASASILSSASAALSSAASSASSKGSAALSSATSGASATSNAGSKVELGYTKFGVALGAGLVAITALSGALVL